MTKNQQDARYSELIRVLRDIRDAYQGSTDPALDDWLQYCWFWLTTQHTDLLRLYWYIPFNKPM